MRRLRADAWAALDEVFAAQRPNNAAESITLTVRHLHGDDRENSATLALCSTFADALGYQRPQLTAFLDEWLPTVSEVDGHDPAFTVPGQRIGTPLAALARSGALPARFHPMIKPYHRFPEFYGDTPSAELRLITCGGTFDRQDRRYLDNIIASARLTGAGR